MLVVYRDKCFGNSHMHDNYDRATERIARVWQRINAKNPPCCREYEEDFTPGELQVQQLPAQVEVFNCSLEGLNNEVFSV